MREKYESLKLAVLKDLAKARGLKGLSVAKKEDVIEAMLKQDELDAKSSPAPSAHAEKATSQESSAGQAPAGPKRRGRPPKKAEAAQAVSPAPAPAAQTASVHTPSASEEPERRTYTKRKEYVDENGNTAPELDPNYVPPVTVKAETAETAGENNEAEPEAAENAFSLDGDSAAAEMPAETEEKPAETEETTPADAENAAEEAADSADGE